MQRGGSLELAWEMHEGHGGDRANLQKHVKIILNLY
jgi:hypothetical protein